MSHGLQPKFKSRLKKKRADGTIVYHENPLFNLILKVIYERYGK